MKPEKAMDAAFFACVETLVAKVKKRAKDNPNYRHVAAAYVLAELGLGVEDIGGIAVHLVSGDEEEDSIDSTA